MLLFQVILVVEISRFQFVSYADGSQLARRAYMYNSYGQGNAQLLDDSSFNKYFMKIQFEGYKKENERTFKFTTDRKRKIGNVMKFTRNENIAGSRSIDVSEMPSNVVIVSTEKPLCSGNLISTARVLTSASCVTEVFFDVSEGFMNYRVLKPEQIVVRLGSNYPRSGGQISFARKIQVHPEFLKNKVIPHYKGIAVITLLNDIELSNTVNVAQIHPYMDKTDIQVLTGETCQVNSMGPTSKGLLGDNLIQSNVTVASNAICKEFYSYKTDVSEHICSLDNHTDPCSRTPGGGLFCSGKLIAIVGPADICLVGNPYVLERVDNALDFINSAALCFRLPLTLTILLYMMFVYYFIL